MRSLNIAIIDKISHSGDKFSINVFVLYAVNIYVTIEKSYKHMFEPEKLIRLGRHLIQRMKP